MIVISILQIRKLRLGKLEDSGHNNDQDYTVTVCVWLMKRPDAGKDGGQEKAVTEDEMVSWHHWLNGHELG